MNDPTASINNKDWKYIKKITIKGIRVTNAQIKTIINGPSNKCVRIFGAHLESLE